MITYITRSRNVGGLEINYTEYQVLLIDDASFNKTNGNPKVLEMVGTFTHERCAQGLCEQLNGALQHGLDFNYDGPTCSNHEGRMSNWTADDKEPAFIDPTQGWEDMMMKAHESLDTLQAEGLRRLADAFGSAPEEVPPYDCCHPGRRRPHKALEGLSDDTNPEYEDADTQYDCYGRRLANKEDET